jgi:hypothetical protein
VGVLAEVTNLYLPLSHSHVCCRISSIGGPGAEFKYIRPRPMVAAYYEVIKARPSFNKVYGAGPPPVLGALGKALLGKLTGQY